MKGRDGSLEQKGRDFTSFTVFIQGLKYVDFNVINYFLGIQYYSVLNATFLAIDFNADVTFIFFILHEDVKRAPAAPFFITNVAYSEKMCIFLYWDKATANVASNFVLSVKNRLCASDISQLFVQQ